LSLLKAFFYPTKTNIKYLHEIIFARFTKWNMIIRYTQTWMLNILMKLASAFDMLLISVGKIFIMIIGLLLTDFIFFPENMLKKLLKSKIRKL
jgi:hypothetical protein